jgi:hypothetical protein
VGTRRTVALDILGPIAATSRGLQLSRIVSITDAAHRADGQPTGRRGDRAFGRGRSRSRRASRAPTKPRPPQRRPGTTPTTVAVMTQPSAAHPLRVLIVGDSLGIDLGGPLQNDLANTGVVQATLDGRESTGLTRPDYFNWPAELQSDIHTAQPQVVVIMMGANDPQDFPGPPDIPYTSPKWNVMYAARVAAFMQIAGSGGATVIWVGMPPMQNAALSAKMSDVDSRGPATSRAPEAAGRTSSVAGL